jgi:hypothetical protein
MQILVLIVMLVLVLILMQILVLIPMVPEGTRYNKKYICDNQFVKTIDRMFFNNAVSNVAAF